MGKTQGLGRISEKDEFKHICRNYPEFHNESWYFNFIDFGTNTHGVTRVGYRIGAHEIETMFLLVFEKDDDQNNLKYLNRVQVDAFPENNIYGDDKIKYECLEPMNKWRLTFNDANFEVDVVCEGRFSPYIYMSQENPLEALKKYGMEILQVAATRHYEQGMKVTGVVRRKEKGQIKEERQINCLGHRDHSWGTRNWLLIDKWNWIACQFEDWTINASRVEVFGKIIEQGFISTAEGHERITNVEVKTEYGDGGNASIPKSSIFNITTPVRQFTLVSKTWKSLYLERPTDRGVTVIHEQIVHFEMGGKKGYGISEYMLSSRNE